MATETDVVATVNGVPVRLAELQYVMTADGKGRGKGADPALVKETLERIIDQELARQRATALKLDQNPEYVRRLRFMEAPVRDFERRTLGAALDEREATEKVQVTDAEARQYFEKNAIRFKTKVRVLQLLVRNDLPRLRAMHEELKAGAAFEAVAARQFPAPALKAPQPPWDLGFLRLDQVPEQWVEALAAMKPGDVSEVLEGPKGRAWVIKLVERQVDESITFEQMKAHLMSSIRAEKGRELRAAGRVERRKSASIVYLRDPGALPPPSKPDP